MFFVLKFIFHNVSTAKRKYINIARDINYFKWKKGED